MAISEQELKNLQHARHLGWSLETGVSLTENFGYLAIRKSFEDLAASSAVSSESETIKTMLEDIPIQILKDFSTKLDMALDGVVQVQARKSEKLSAEQVRIAASDQIRARFSYSSISTIIATLDTLNNGYQASQLTKLLSLLRSVAPYLADYFPEGKIQYSFEKQSHFAKEDTLLEMIEQGSVQALYRTDLYNFVFPDQVIPGLVTKVIFDENGLSKIELRASIQQHVSTLGEGLVASMPNPNRLALVAQKTDEEPLFLGA